MRKISMAEYKYYVKKKGHEKSNSLIITLASTIQR